MSSRTADHLEVLVTDPGLLYELLDEAEAELRTIPQSLSGILVTRHSAGRYTVALSSEVPYGETRERTLSAACSMARIS
ncbi:hypothetical protein SCMU_40750 [Sinomonas cyclohexanicum]|uniref:Uncharacterized protein n=1 Tax=Sinomonas cyclohexanicum TaxID=322009 RepID=A0ABN6FRY7_SINCY|nr:hypothetical protein SCMU_40750 [Corynebacterium cyclohexanicum]